MPRTRTIPTYVRVELTSRCPLACSFCHAEGNGHASMRPDLRADELAACLRAICQLGFVKFKLLGGEPLVRKELPALVGVIREASPTADISLITSGVGSHQLLMAAFERGLDRANLSIHGFGLEAFGERGGDARKLALRDKVLATLLERGRPLKLNYVYRGPRDDLDLSALLDHAAGLPVVVGLLDDLSDPAAGPHTVYQALCRLRGEHLASQVVADPHSLPTTELRYADGLRVEVKTSQLGQIAPWRMCQVCPARSRCREGIFAIRVTPSGLIQPCMDRPDWTLPFVDWVRDHGEAGAAARVHDFLEEAIA